MDELNSLGYESRFPRSVDHHGGTTHLSGTFPGDDRASATLRQAEALILELPRLRSTHGIPCMIADAGYGGTGRSAHRAQSIADSVRPSLGSSAIRDSC